MDTTRPGFFVPKGPEFPALVAAGAGASIPTAAIRSMGGMFHSGVPRDPNPNGREGESSYFTSRFYQQNYPPPAPYDNRPHRKRNEREINPWHKEPIPNPIPTTNPNPPWRQQNGFSPTLPQLNFMRPPPGFSREMAFRRPDWAAPGSRRPTFPRFGFPVAVPRGYFGGYPSGTVFYRHPYFPIMTDRGVQYSPPLLSPPMRKKPPTQIPIYAILINGDHPGNPWTNFTGRSSQTASSVTSEEEIQVPHKLAEEALHECWDTSPQNVNVDNDYGQYGTTDVAYNFLDLEELTASAKLDLNESQPNDEEHPEQPFGDGRWAGISDRVHKGFKAFSEQYGEGEEVDGRNAGQSKPDAENEDIYSSGRVIFENHPKYYYDERPITNYIQPGQKPFNLFEDCSVPILRHVYDVNELDETNVVESCCKQVCSATIKQLPAFLFGHELNGMKRHVVLEESLLEAQQQEENEKQQRCTAEECNEEEKSNNQDECVNENSDENYTETEDVTAQEFLGAYGLSSLANLYRFNDVQTNPMGHLTFIGMNLFKVVANIDQCYPLTPGFAGPFAAHNHVLTPTCINVTSGAVQEYHIPYQPTWESKTQRKFKQFMMLHEDNIKTFGFEVVVFIFYDFPRDALQLIAAGELYRRGWRYHKTYQVWARKIQRPGMPPPNHSSKFWEPGSYQVFFPYVWRSYIGLHRIRDDGFEGEPQKYNRPLWTSQYSNI